MLLHMYLSVFDDKYQSCKYEKHSREICYLLASLCGDLCVEVEGVPVDSLHVRRRVVEGGQACRVPCRPGLAWLQLFSLFFFGCNFFLSFFGCNFKLMFGTKLATQL